MQVLLKLTFVPVSNLMMMGKSPSSTVKTDLSTSTETGRITNMVLATYLENSGWALTAFII